MPSNPTTHRPWRSRSSRPAAAGLAGALMVTLIVGCSDDPEVPENQHYIVQGNQLAQGDMRVGLMSVRGDEANIQVYAEDAEDTEVVRVSEGDSVDVGRRTITVERIDSGDDEGVAVTIDDPESPPPENGSESEDASSQEGAEGPENPMEDPDVFAVRVGHRANESGLTIGLGSAADGTARLLVSGDGVEEQEVEVEAGDEVELGDQTLVAVEVGDGTAYFRIED